MQSFLFVPPATLTMSPSLNVLLGLLTVLPLYRLAQAARFPAPLLEPLLEERQASTVPDYVVNYGMQQSHHDVPAVQV